MRKLVALIGLLMVLNGCYGETPKMSNNLLFFDLHTEGISILGNWVILPETISTHEVKEMRVLKIFDIEEFEIPESAVLCCKIVEDTPLVLVELLGENLNFLGFMVINNPVVHLQTHEDLIVSVAEERTMDVR